MNRLDVRFIRLVQVEIGTSGAEEGSDDKIDFTISKTIRNREVRDNFSHSRSTSRSTLKEILTSFPNNTATPLKKV